MGGGETRLQAEEDIPLRPRFREKVVPFVQADSMNRQGGGNSLAKISGEAFSCHGLIFQGRQLVEKSMVEFVPQRLEALIDLMLLHDGVIGFSSPKCHPRPIILAVRSR